MFDKKYRKSELPKHIKRLIKEKEQDLGRTCRSIWSFTNPKNEHFLFASFCKNYDKLIVTLGYYYWGIGWLPQR